MLTSDALKGPLDPVIPTDPLLCHRRQPTLGHQVDPRGDGVAAAMHERQGSERAPLSRGDPPRL